MPRRYQRAAKVPAPAAEVFARLDDQTRLAAHMEQPSAMMGGGRMTYRFDAGRGQAIGSHIWMGGSAFGLTLSVEEVVVEREPPRHKLWRTSGPTRLIIMTAYSMGFEIDPEPGGCRLTVWIDYQLAPGIAGVLVGPLAALYARWCVGRMVDDAVSYFESERAKANQATPGSPRPA